MYTYTNIHKTGKYIYTNPMIASCKTSAHFKDSTNLYPINSFCSFWPNRVLINYFKFVNFMEEKCLEVFLICT